MVDELNPPKKKRGRKKGVVHIGESKFGTKNLSTSDGIKFDSPLTFRGTERKRKFALRRYRNLDYYGGTLSKAEYLKLKESCIIKLLSFCQRYSTIYTNITGERDDGVYIDVMTCVNNRIYRITRLVAIILGKKIANSKSRRQYDKIVWRPPHDEYGQANPKRDNLRYAETIVKEMSQIMFNCDDGFFWQDLSQIYSFNSEYRPKQKQHAIPKKPEEIVVDKPEEVGVESKPKKSFRVR